MSSCPEDHELKREALAAYEGEYADLAVNWRSLDTKAQGSVTIAGVFIGGALALAQYLSADTGLWTRLAFAAGVFALLGSVASALDVLRIRTVTGLPDGDAVRKLVTDLIAVSEAERPARYPLYLENYLNAWKTGNQEVSAANDSKAASLWRSQKLIAAAIALFAILVLLELAERIP